MPYAELHCHSNFSFLDGASHPEELAEEADRLGLEALALTDHDGCYGIVRFAEAARPGAADRVRLRALTLGRTAPQPGVADPGVPEPGTPGAPRATRGRRAGQVALAGLDLAPGLPDPGRCLAGETHLVVLARDRAATPCWRAPPPRRSCAAPRGRRAPRSPTWRRWPAPGCPPPAPTATAGWCSRAAARGRWRGRWPSRGPPPPSTARPPGRCLRGANVAVELWDHGDPLDSARNDALVQLAARAGVDVVATNNVHYARPAQRALATAVAAVRARRSLDEIDGWLPAASSAHLRSGAEQARRFARYPGAVERAAELGLACAFDLHLVAPKLPPFPCPDGHDEMSWLRELTERGAERRYGPRGAERVPGAYAQIDHELALIDQLGFPGYFLVVWDIVEFCRRADIYCQGRGSAANSAVCYALGITNADAVSLGLLFERFLSPERDGPPDIDIDIESDRREEVIQHVYATHGRQHAALVANVVTYRSRSAIRDVAKALGFATGQQDAWAKQADRWSALAPPTGDDGAPYQPSPSPEAPVGEAAEHPVPEAVLALARQIEHAPRQLGIHSGGMVICDRPVVEVCPVEWARMEGRSVLQWDKDDCAAAGLVKFDLLGLGMLSALHYCIDLVDEHHGLRIDLAHLPQDPAVYDMLCEADTVGVFQIESRAQMATLPRLRPRCFYDLVVEVALIRPGPIQCGSVHPYIRRRNGEEPVTYLHPLLERSLAKTLGVPLFQEQLMQMAIDVAGFTPAEADQLRQAMGSKRSVERMERLRARLDAGMAANGITPEVGQAIWEKLVAFANYGFPESHSVSFAYLVYASSYLKKYYPAAFCAALVNAQPMGFYSPHSLTQDARRHGVEVRTPDLAHSGVGATLEWHGTSCEGARDQTRARHPSAAPLPYPFGGRMPAQPAVRIGLSSVRGIGTDLAEVIVAERDANGPFASMEDCKRRVDMRLAAAAAGAGRTRSSRTARPARLELAHLEALATAGAFGSFTDADGCRLDRRRALWQAGAVAQSAPDRLAGVVTGAEAPRLPGMDPTETAGADLWATGIAPDGHPTRFLRPELDRLGVVPADRLRHVEHGERIVVGGVVTHRQRPATASGTTFVNLEDETGLINVICSRGCWVRYRSVARSAAALLVRGRVERQGQVVNIVAERLEPLQVGAADADDPTTAAAPRSRDFR
ncbi:MAG: error-prone DNA polymerase [Acidimicrobiales bacterium]